MNPTHYKIHQTALSLAILIALTGITGCKEKKTPELTKAAPVEVSVMTIEPAASKSDTFDLHAKVEPNRIGRISAEVAGRIEDICCQEGDRVTARPNSKPIIKLNTDLLTARLKQAKAQCDIDAADYARMQKFRASQTATESEFEHSREKANTSKAILEEAQAMLDRTQIFPQFDGVLNNRPVEKGDYVQPGTIVAEIVDTETVKIVAHVPERNIHFLNFDDKTTIIYTYQNQPRTLDAKITFISKLAHAQSLTTKIEVKVDNSAGEFFSGQIVSLRLKRRDLKNVIMIPMDSVIPLPQSSGQSKYAAYVVEDKKAVRRTGLVIDLSFIEGKNVRLVSGLKAGDKLVVIGLRQLDASASYPDIGPGQDVNVIVPEKQTEKGI
ncbi:MAG: efflux RND transporter periplasmic adaptor subunit [Phycisphaerales bacterium]|jgi:membrane fusion protein, multidrug efflux system|nr:efflux RND transporter periplasmic adaptor subunit [Phycisphaerales bacterium]